MSRAIKVLRMPLDEKLLLAETLVQIVAIRIGLWILPFRIVRDRALHAAARPPRHSTSRFSLERLIRIVVAESRCVPGATCLTQALAAHIMLGRYGHASRLRIGVAKDAAGAFEAHAWLESAGAVVLGGQDLGRYTSLLAIGNDPV